MRPGQVEERRQQRPLADLPGGDELRHREGLAASGRRRAAWSQVDVRQGAVGGAEVDADEIAHEHRA